MSAPPHDKPSSRSERIQTALASIPLFAELDGPAQLELARCARLREVPADEVVIERGEPAHALFAIQRGKLKVVAPRPGGRDATLHILGPGDVFGEVALFQDKGRTARVTALEDALLIVLDRRDFLQLVQRSGDLATRVLTLMARRLSDTIAHFDTTTSREVPQRLALKLLSLHALFGVSQAAGQSQLLLSLSQSDLAELVDSSRQTVNRLLSTWRDQGIVRHQDGKLVVLDLEALRTIAES
jgi:CRP/FNR family transcriptional regulator, cyclic AMP receptor protein